MARAGVISYGGVVTHEGEYFITTFEINDFYAWWKDRHCPIWDEREDFDDGTFTITRKKCHCMGSKGASVAVHCDHSALPAVPLGIPAWTTRLYLQFNRLGNVYKQMLQGFERERDGSITLKEISGIKKPVAVPLSSLHTIRLDGNPKIAKVDELFFEGTSHGFENTTFLNLKQVYFHRDIVVHRRGLIQREVNMTAPFRYRPYKPPPLERPEWKLFSKFEETEYWQDAYEDNLLKKHLKYGHARESFHSLKESF